MEGKRIGNYQINKKIGAGAFAVVYQGTNLLTSTNVAIKIIPKKHLKEEANLFLLKREVNIFKTIDHPFIAMLFEVLDDQELFYIIEEFASRGSLLEHINRNHGLSEDEARRIFFQIIETLEYLHQERHIIHRDLKAENILLGDDLNIRLIDFGLSRTFSEKDPFLQTTCGSPAYMAPEILKQEPYTTSTDIWALGILLYAMTVGSLPFNSAHITTLFNDILYSQTPLPCFLSIELQDLISKLLKKDPNTRISLDEIFQHPWIQADTHNFLKSSFLKAHHWFVLNPRDIDSEVVEKLESLNISTDGLSENLASGTINVQTSIYKIIKKIKVNSEIVKMESENDSPQTLSAREMESHINSKLPSLNTSRDSLQCPATGRVFQVRKRRLTSLPHMRTRCLSGKTPPVPKPVTPISIHCGSKLVD